MEKDDQKLLCAQLFYERPAKPTPVSDGSMTVRIEDVATGNVLVGIVQPERLAK